MNGWILNEHTISICQALSQHQDISGSDEHASFPPLRKIKKKKTVTEGDTCRAEGESAMSLGCLQGTGATAGTIGQTQLFF